MICINIEQKKSNHTLCYAQAIFILYTFKKQLIKLPLAFTVFVILKSFFITFIINLPRNESKTS
jgi:hypothetical protein